ncbi:MAG: DUF362 domain-containing protein [Gemmatimonadota bacterium]|nr:MAG: DUF362 domain-containing protein [Gemmatimonadota bacterium]
MCRREEKSQSRQTHPRRTFLKKIASLGMLSLLGRDILPRRANAGVTAFPPRKRIPNPYVSSEGKPILVCVSGTDFGEMLRTGLERIGGLEKLIDSNQDVLIKPNLNASDVYPAISSAESIAALAREIGGVTSGSVKVGDVGFHSASRVYNHINLEKTLSGTGAEAVYFSETYDVRRAPFIKTLASKSLWNPSKPNISVYSDAYDAPIIISLTSIKRHFLAHMSTALKNNVGAVAGSGASRSREYLHSLRDKSFLREVAEIARVIQPELTVVDARSVLIGNGPFSDYPGAEILDGIHLLIMSGDMIAVDLYCSLLLQGYDDTFSSWQINYTVQHAHALGVGVGSLDEVEIIEPVASVESSPGSSVPGGFELYQNYPNPFNASTHIGFRIEEKRNITLHVYDSLGRRVSTLVKREMSPGEYSFTFDGNGLPSGTYFYQLKVGRSLVTKKMMLLK